MENSVTALYTRKISIKTFQQLKINCFNASLLRFYSISVFITKPMPPLSLELSAESLRILNKEECLLI